MQHLRRKNAVYDISPVITTKSTVDICDYSISQATYYSPFVQKSLNDTWKASQELY